MRKMIYKLQKILIYFLIHVACAENLLPQDCSEKYCYDLDFDKLQRFKFGSKVPYPRYTDFDINKEFKVPDCSPIKLWLLVRHGSRLPAVSELDDFAELALLHSEIMWNYKNGTIDKRCRMCSADFELLENWKYRQNISQMKANQLQPDGMYDMERLAKNLQKMFPTLLEPKYSQEKYLFGFASEHRTKYSYMSFVDGLFGEGAHKHIPMPTSVSGRNDTLLQPYSQCKPSIKNSKLVDARWQQADKFTRTKRFEQLVRDVSLRLGFGANSTSDMLDIESILNVWHWCKYEQTWHLLDPSPWCVAFLPHHYSYLEYYDEIKFYYKKAYGAPVTLKLACTAVNNMLYYLDNRDSHKVIAYFVHSTLMQLFYTALEFFKDPEHIRADNYDQMQDRQFRSSVNLPLSSNLAVVKYECPLEREKHKVMFLLNQKPMNISWCQNGICSLSEIKRRYSHFVTMDCKASFCDVDFKGFPQYIFLGTENFSLYLLLILCFSFMLLLWTKCKLKNKFKDENKKIPI